MIFYCIFERGIRSVNNNISINVISNLYATKSECSIDRSCLSHRYMKYNTGFMLSLDMHQLGHSLNMLL